jgi:large subunit ribosomal protein L18
MSVLRPYQLKLFLSNQYAYAQIMRAVDNHVVASASTIEKQIREGLQSTLDVTACGRWVPPLPRPKSRSLCSLPCSPDIFRAPPLPPPLSLSRVGEVLAQRAKDAGIEGVQWRRKPGQRYHGRLAALVDGLRQSGIKLL